MKKMIMMICLLISVCSWAEGDMIESHGNREQEKQCFKEIRALGCTGDDEAFIICVDTKIKELSVGCQSFHIEEKERMKSHSH